MGQCRKQEHRDESLFLCTHFNNGFGSTVLRISNIAGAPQIHSILPFTHPPPLPRHPLPTASQEAGCHRRFQRFTDLSHLPKLCFVISLKNFCDHPGFLIFSILIL